MGPFESVVNKLYERDDAPAYDAQHIDDLARKPPKKLYHVTLFANKILSSGFKSRTALGGQSVLGGGSDDSVSFTDDLAWAESYANGLRVSVEAVNTEFDPYNFMEYRNLLKKYGFDPAPLRRTWEWVEGGVEKMKDSIRWRRVKPNKIKFTILQGFSMDTRGAFPLFMGGDWPDAIEKAKLSDVAILQISSDGPQWWDYKPGEREYRIFDTENIGKPKKVG